MTLTWVEAGFFHLGRPWIPHTARRCQLTAPGPSRSQGPRVHYRQKSQIRRAGVDSFLPYGDITHRFVRHDGVICPVKVMSTSAPRRSAQDFGHQRFLGWSCARLSLSLVLCPHTRVGKINVSQSQCRFFALNNCFKWKQDVIASSYTDWLICVGSLWNQYSTACLFICLFIWFICNRITGI